RGDTKIGMREPGVGTVSRSMIFATNRRVGDSDVVQNDVGMGREEASAGISVIGNVISSRTLDLRQLGWISGKRAGTRSNFPANFEYVDLRGLSLADLERALDEERRAYALLEAAGFDQGSINEIDRQRAASPFIPILDFGVVSAVVAISALGCVPVTS